MLTFILVLLVFSVLILIHEAGHLFAAKRTGVVVETFSLGFGRRLCGFKRGGTDYRISLIPFGGYVKMAGDDPAEAEGKEGELLTKAPGQRFWIMVAGSFTNYVFAFILFSIIFMVGVPMASNEVGRVLEGFPAEEAGIKAGDEIVSINGKQTEYWEDIVGAIKEFSVDNIPLDVEIDRKGKIAHFEIKPHVSEVKNIFGQIISTPLIGVGPQPDKIIPVAHNPLDAICLGAERLASLTAMTYKGIWLLLTGGIPVKSSVSGPIGIARLMGQAADLGIVPLLIITAHVSMALAIFNLLPFPILDGGHIIFLGLEKLRGKPLSLKVQDIITQAALVLLIAFAVFVSWQDILRITPMGK